MDRQHRRDLKHDKFVDEIGILSSKAHQNQRLLYGIAAAAIALALIAYGTWFYRSNRERHAQVILGTAIETIDSPLIPAPQPNQPPGQPPQPPDPRAKFKTEAERSTAAEKQFKDVQAKYPGTDAADIADLFLARIAASKGDVAGARKLLQGFVDNHPKNLLVGPARYSLYQFRIDGGESKKVADEINAELAKKEPILPGDSLLILLAHSYEVQGNEQKSRETYKRLVTEFPDSPFALEAQRRTGPA